VKIFNEVRLLALLAMALILPGLIPAQQGVVEGVEESGKINVPGFGELYREMIWKRDGSRMVLIPGGTYKIGRPAKFDEGDDTNEVPEVTVTISPFYIDKYEVTNAQYNKVASAIGLGLPQSIANQELLEDNKPIVGINFDDARNYANTVGKDIPTEAEWEVAARGPQGTLYPYGNSFVSGNAHLNVGITEGSIEVGTHPKDISGFGVHDMGGNVSEWVLDYYKRGYYAEVDGKTDPVISEPTESVSVRGGNYIKIDDDDGRATLRSSVIPIYSREEVGFRTVFRIEKPRPTPTPTPIPPTPTPTPDPKIKVDQMKRLLTPYFKNTNSSIPVQYVRLGAGGPGEKCVFYNQSPFRVTLGFVETDAQLIFKFPTTVSPYSAAVVTIPTELSLRTFAYAGDAPYQELVDLGPFTADSKPMIIIPSDTFTNVIGPGDEIREPVPNRKATQYYLQTYQPDWNILEFFNDTGRPVEVVLARELPDGKTQDESVRILDDQQVALFNEFPGANLKLTAKYLGADGEKKIHALSFRNDSKTDRKFIVLRKDPLGQGYSVFGEKVQPIDFRQNPFNFPDSIENDYFIQ